MIVPTRFGLKYAPIPTLALEYEDDLKGVAEAAGDDPTSLYVHRDGDGPAPSRKLHVVELPLLTRTSETQQITRQLQQDNERFLAPGVVSETQLKRLLDRLVQNLPSSEVREPTSPEVESESREDAASESELEESAMEESVMEESAVETSVAEASRVDEQEAPEAAVLSTTLDNLNRGAFVSHDAESDGESGSGDEAREEAPPAIDTECSHDELEESDQNENPLPAEAERDEESEAEEAEDAKKTKALRSDSDVSEEDVQSEELEYFSEDGSDEDSF